MKLTTKMATEALRVENPESIEVLSREADSLKSKLEDDKAKLNDIDSRWWLFCIRYIQGLK